MIDVYKNKKLHAEKYFITDLSKRIDALLKDKKVSKIEANLVQNYSPCNGYPGYSGCVDDILEFKEGMERKGVSFSLKIKFANFYKCYYKQGNDSWKKSQNIDGLVKLLQNDVRLQLLEGEKGWEDFLNDEMFMDVSEKNKTHLLEIATSKERIKREKVDKEILKYIKIKALGKPKTTK